MSRDIFSMIGKQSSRVKSQEKIAARVASAVTANLLSLSLSETHKTIIIDEYIVKIHPISTQSRTPSRKFVAFDLDGTLITTKSGHTFSRGPNDWTWLNDKVVPSLQSITLPIVIFTNQGAVIAQKTSKSLSNFTKKCKLILDAMKEAGIDVSNVWIYASPKMGKTYKGKNEAEFTKMRKPEIGMFEHLLKDGVLEDVIKEECVYVGDAAGRATDFSDSDKKFAQNCDIPFKTPEEYFV